MKVVPNQPRAGGFPQLRLGFGWNPGR